MDEDPKVAFQQKLLADILAVLGWKIADDFAIKVDPVLVPEPSENFWGVRQKVVKERCHVTNLPSVLSDEIRQRMCEMGDAELARADWYKKANRLAEAVRAEREKRTALDSAVTRTNDATADVFGRP